MNWRQQAPAPWKTRPSFEQQERGWWLAWFVVGTFLIGHVVTNGLLTFPSDWDSVMYHLPLIVQWLHAKSLYAPDCAHWSFPANNEIVGLWIVAPFSGDFLIPFMNLPTVVLLALAAVELGRLVGLSPTFRHVTALAVIGNRLVVYQLVSQKNDLAVVGLFLATLAYGLRYLNDGKWTHLVLGALSIGVLCGVKWFALGYAAVALGVVTTLAVYGRSPRTAASLAAAWVIGIVLFSGYWYMRNWVITGQPFYPMALASQNPLEADLYPASWWSTTFLGNGSAELLPLAVAAITKRVGLCYLLAVLLLPLSGALLLGTVFLNRAQRKDEIARLLLSLSLVGALCVVLVTPFTVEDVPGTLAVLRYGYGAVRYGMSFLSLALVALAWLLQASGDGLKLFSAAVRPIRPFRTWLPFVPQLVFAGLVMYEIYRALTDLSVDVSSTLLVAVDVPGAVLAAMSILLFGVIVYQFSVGWPEWRRATALLATVMFVAAMSVAIGWLSSRWHRGFAKFYDAQMGTHLYSYFTAQYRGEIRLAAFNYHLYPAFGSRRQFRVIQPLVVPSYPWLSRYLHEHRVTHVIVRSDAASPLERFRRYGAVHRFLAEHPDRFHRVKESYRYTLFRVGNRVRDRPPLGTPTARRFPRRLGAGRTGQFLRQSPLR